ncbi:Protein MOR1 [Camellia lanceoleosa]|uniref:Protein MOR1 n=1 Tax=Camellia lanceoleosa TaxID=1840588 RepID=A0ACC0FRN0_9ERIC|nr:Protein MOR1 [Camellia lanceoleosa]
MASANAISTASILTSPKQGNLRSRRVNQLLQGGQSSCILDDQVKGHRLNDRLEVVSLKPCLLRMVEGILSDVLKCLGDNKKHMRESTLTTLDAWLAAVHLDKMVPYITNALMDAKLGTEGRKDLFDWLSRQLSGLSNFPDARRWHIQGGSAKTTSRGSGRSVSRGRGRGNSSGRGSSAKMDNASGRGNSSGWDSSARRGNTTTRGSSAGKGSSSGRGKGKANHAQVIPRGTPPMPTQCVTQVTQHHVSYELTYEVTMKLAKMLIFVCL